MKRKKQTFSGTSILNNEKRQKKNIFKNLILLLCNKDLRIKNWFPTITKSWLIFLHKYTAIYLFLLLLYALVWRIFYNIALENNATAIQAVAWKNESNNKIW